MEKDPPGAKKCSSGTFQFIFLYTSEKVFNDKSSLGKAAAQKAAANLRNLAFPEIPRVILAIIQHSVTESVGIIQLYTGRVPELLPDLFVSG